MRSRDIIFSDKTWDAVHELADLTEVKAEDRFQALVQDALRLYEWIIYQQANGRTVTCLEPDDVKVLTQSSAVHGPREVLEPLVPEEKLSKARDYFQKAA